MTRMMTITGTGNASVPVILFFGKMTTTTEMTLEEAKFEISQRLLLAIRKGPVEAIGGTIYDAHKQTVMSTADLHSAIRALARRGIVIRRMSELLPTWDIE